MFKDAHHFSQTWLKCQSLGANSKKDKMPLNSTLVVEIFDGWGLDFIGNFLTSFGYEYILVAIYHISK